MHSEIIIYSNTYTHKEIAELCKMGFTQCGNILSYKGNKIEIPNRKYDVVEIFKSYGNKSLLVVKNNEVPTLNGFHMHVAYVYFDHKNKIITIVRSPSRNISRSMDLYLKAFHPMGHYVMKENIYFVASLIDYKINDITDTLDLNGNIYDVLTKKGYPFFHEYTNSPFRIDGPGKFFTTNRFPIILDIVNSPHISNWMSCSFGMHKKVKIYNL